MINISNIDIENLQYETKVENGVLYYYVNSIKIDKYDLLAAASNESSLERALEIIEVADHLFGVSPTDYTYFSLRNCVYENIMWEKSSRTELYYQDVFKKHIKEILGNNYELVKKTSDNRNIPDAWVSCNNEIIPVEMKIGNFDGKALKQLLRYMNKYDTKNGIAIGRQLAIEIPSNIQFIPIDVVKSFDEYK